MGAAAPRCSRRPRAAVGARAPTTGRSSRASWRLATGVPWRDLPERFGPWKTVYSRFRRWQRAGVWDQVLATLQADADAAGALDWTLHFLDGTTVRAHPDAAGAQGGGDQALGHRPRRLLDQAPPPGRAGRQADLHRPDAGAAPRSRPGGDAAGAGGGQAPRPRPAAGPTRPGGQRQGLRGGRCGASCGGQGIQAVIHGSRPESRRGVRRAAPPTASATLIERLIRQLKQHRAIATRYEEAGGDLPRPAHHRLHPPLAVILPTGLANTVPFVAVLAVASERRGAVMVGVVCICGSRAESGGSVARAMEGAVMSCCADTFAARRPTPTPRTTCAVSSPTWSARTAATGRARRLRSPTRHPAGAEPLRLGRRRGAGRPAPASPPPWAIRRVLIVDETGFPSRAGTRPASPASTAARWARSPTARSASSSATPATAGRGHRPRPLRAPGVVRAPARCRGPRSPRASPCGPSPSSPWRWWSAPWRLGSPRAGSSPTRSTATGSCGGRWRRGQVRPRRARQRDALTLAALRAAGPILPSPSSRGRSRPRRGPGSAAARAPKAPASTTGPATRSAPPCGGWVHALLARRHPDRSAAVAYYLVYAPLDAPLVEVVRAARARWTRRGHHQARQGRAGARPSRGPQLARLWCRHVTLALPGPGRLGDQARREGDPPAAPRPLPSPVPAAARPPRLDAARAPSDVLRLVALAAPTQKTAQDCHRRRRLGREGTVILGGRRPDQGGAGGWAAKLLLPPLRS